MRWYHGKAVSRCELEIWLHISAHCCYYQSWVMEVPLKILSSNNVSQPWIKILFENRVISELRNWLFFGVFLFCFGVFFNIPWSSWSRQVSLSVRSTLAALSWKAVVQTPHWADGLIYNWRTRRQFYFSGLDENLLQKMWMVVLNSIRS